VVTHVLALVRRRRLVRSFLGACKMSNVKEAKTYFSKGDFVTHSKIGSQVGIIVEFVSTRAGQCAWVDYGDFKRLEFIKDILPIRRDI
jgi:hypothetical protein